MFRICKRSAGGSFAWGMFFDVRGAGNAFWGYKELYELIKVDALSAPKVLLPSAAMAEEFLMPPYAVRQDLAANRIAPPTPFARWWRLSLPSASTRLHG